MFGLSFWEIGMILVVALIVLGPTKLPELARGLGKGLREFRKATEDFRSTVSEEMHKPEATPPPRRELPPREAELETPAAKAESPRAPATPDEPR